MKELDREDSFTNDVLITFEESSINQLANHAIQATTAKEHHWLAR